MIGNQCPECDHVLRNDLCSNCGWKSTRADDEKPSLPAYRVFPDRRSSFRPCEHVAVGAERACPECEEEIQEYRRQFREFGRRIEARNVQL